MSCITGQTETLRSGDFKGFMATDISLKTTSVNLTVPLKEKSGDDQIW